MAATKAKLLAVLATAGLATYLVVPNLLYAALPLVVLAACPLSMFVRLRMMSGDKSGQGRRGPTPTTSSHVPSDTEERDGPRNDEPATQQAEPLWNPEAVQGPLR